MKPYYKTRMGSYLNKPWGTGTTEYSDVQESHAENLSGVVSNKGNKKQPLAQAFTKTLDVRWVGTLYAESVGSSPLVWSRISGVVGIGAPSIAGPVFSNLAYNDAVSKIYDQIRGSLDLSVDAGQMKQAKTMVQGAVYGMDTLASTITKMRRNPLRASKIWLQYVYGWKPLAGSIYQTLDQLLKPDVTYVKASARAQELAYDTAERGSYNGVPYRFDLVKSMRCYMEVNYKLSNSALQQMAGYTSLNPVSIAWELTPYSFVVDWFVNLGGYLRNLESAIAYKQAFGSGYYTQTSLTTGEILCKGVGQSGSLRTIPDLKYGYRGAKKQRTPLGGPPMPRAPVLHVDLGLSQFANGTALLLSMLHGNPTGALKEFGKIH